MSKIVSIETGKAGFNGASLPIKASVAFNCLVNIYEKKHELTPELVLEEAKKKDNPLHKCFEWDNSKAADKYRLTQARDIIRCIVVDKNIHGKMVPVRAFVNLQTDEEGQLSTNPFAKGKSSYVYVDNAMSTEVLAKYTVNRALIDLEHVMDKYNNLVELRGLFSAVKKKIEVLRKGKKKLKEAI